MWIIAFLFSNFLPAFSSLTFSFSIPLRSCPMVYELVFSDIYFVRTAIHFTKFQPSPACLPACLPDRFVQVVPPRALRVARVRAGERQSEVSEKLRASSKRKSFFNGRTNRRNGLLRFASILPRCSTLRAYRRERRKEVE